MYETYTLPRFVLALAFLTQCHAVALPYQVRQVSTNETQTGFSPHLRTSLDISWLSFVDEGLGILRRSYPLARLIGVVTSASVDVPSVSLLDSYGIITDDAHLGHILIRCERPGSWDSPQIVPGESHHAPTLSWPPRFDIRRAAELSGAAGYTHGFYYVQLEADLTALDAAEYLFVSNTGQPMRWVVRTRDGSVVPNHWTQSRKVRV